MVYRRIVRWIKCHRVGSVLLLIFGFLLIAYWFSLPRELFGGTVYSTVVTDRSGELLGARIADDGQWRFPPSDTVPAKFEEALIAFEDRTFRYHPGVNPFAVARALFQNIRSHKVVSGGSTLTMQTIRLSRNGQERNLWQKIIEAVLATRLEIRCSKDEILALYASHAPFGGNVVGLEAASWRYFGRPAEDLSWAEAATLAVLPNSPSMIHPGKNRDVLKAKRDRLLAVLHDKGRIDDTSFGLACDEPLPSAPLPLPQYAPHLTQWHCLYSKGKIVRTPVDLGLQKRVSNTVDRWHENFSREGIGDIAAVVIDIRSGEAVAYCGNAGYGSGRPGSEVDAARAPRSTGSILKPFLYCALLQEGMILPKTLLPDIPVNINGFSPHNFDRQFYGAVPADEALARSLNVPSVHSLRKYGVPKFHSLMQEAGMTTLTRPASDYGLSLILGGAEGTLGEITSIYAKMAATLTNEAPAGFPLKDRMAVYCTFEALKEVNRPDEMDWRMISSVRKVAWKTGTSFGFRDAWAVGVTPDYAVGVWVGNAGGEGSPGLVGARTAGPVMFDIFNLLPASGWFEEPGYQDYITAEVCRKSGHLKGLYCMECDTLMLPKAALRTAPCPYHRPVAMGDSSSEPCAAIEFVLPPAMEWYYKEHHPEYKPVRSGVTSSGPMEFIYPENGSTIFLPRQLDGSQGYAVFSLAHSNPEATVFWHLDDRYVGETKFVHQSALRPSPGKHTCTVVDNAGNTLTVGFTIK